MYKACLVHILPDFGVVSLYSSNTVGNCAENLVIILISISLMITDVHSFVYFLVIPVSSPLEHLFKHIALILMGSLITVLGVIYIPYILMPY